MRRKIDNDGPANNHSSNTVEGTENRTHRARRVKQDMPAILPQEGLEFEN